ncbi:MAG: transposase [Anaerolineales bacterium]
MAKKRKPLFGVLEDEEIRLNEAGGTVAEEWQRSAALRPEISLDEFVVMPNHFHAILFINDSGELKPIEFGARRERGALGAHGRAPLHRNPRTLGSLVAAFKAATTRRIRDIVGIPDLLVWQRNYYDRIIRNQSELEKVREYILYNPLLLSQKLGDLWT